MDESWKIRNGMPSPSPETRHIPNSGHRRSTEDTTSHRRKPISGDPPNPVDFSDVFGGPPRTVLSRQFSTGFPRKDFSYEEIFRAPDNAPPRSGRSLPEFRLPGQQRRSDHNQPKRENGGFYSDIFGWEDERVVRSRSRSKASSSSVLSSEELSPLRPAVSGDCDENDVSYFASKLRPINVTSRWDSRKTTTNHEDYARERYAMPIFAGNNQPFCNTENHYSDNSRGYTFGLSRRNTSPETISIEPISNGSFRVSADDLELNSPAIEEDDLILNSPASAVSSVCHSSEREQRIREMEDEILRRDVMEEDEEEDDDDDDVMSSYIIEINSDNKESNGVDEAIAWAKEKFQTNSCPEENKWESETGKETLNGNQVSEGRTESFGSLDEKGGKWAAEDEIRDFECRAQREMQMLDEKIRLWSTGKETDIRLLLSSLHHILWPNSGWSAIPLPDIIEVSLVKKAYQKARLCLHPDKLQQRGATLPQKYIAEKAFTVLQDAWTAFVF